MDWTHFTKAAQLTPMQGRPATQVAKPATPVAKPGASAPGARTANPATPATPSTPSTPSATAATPMAAGPGRQSAAQRPYDFNGELLGLMKPLAKEYRADPGRYSADGVDLVQRLARDMRATYADMRRNPSRYGDAQKRRIMAGYRRQVQAIRDSASRRYISAYNGTEAPSPYDPNAGWRQVGNGIYIIPRKSPSGPIDYFSGDYGGQLGRHRLAAADWRQVARWNNRMRLARR